MYASTMDPLRLLYDQLVPGAVVYVDDYGSYAGCRKAVDEFRAARGIHSEIHTIAEDTFINDRISKYLKDGSIPPNMRPKDGEFEASWWVV